MFIARAMLTVLVLIFDLRETIKSNQINFIGIKSSHRTTGTHLLIEIIDASWKANAHYNGVCMRRGDCYICVIHFLCVTCFAFFS